MMRPLMAKADAGVYIDRGGCQGWRDGDIEADRTTGGIVIVIPQQVGLTDAQFSHERAIRRRLQLRYRSLRRPGTPCLRL
ncbi:MAG: hypothetical protein ETSY2_03490 [Candidatus Entotheonella gemina]|uniref:Uncharacterized protein n=1 Tax=Candidatus Entotheonella gemina TaxID=1429439 RepID=W4MEY3_9BACT|nr:MAG: hypothetical protein ETSY2_03490 [Candidatus Entotheonella gemina]